MSRFKTTEDKLIIKKCRRLMRSNPTILSIKKKQSIHKLIIKGLSVFKMHYDSGYVLAGWSYQSYFIVIYHAVFVSGRYILYIYIDFFFISLLISGWKVWRKKYDAQSV